MPGGVVTANEIHGSKLQGYYEGAIAAAGTNVPYQGPAPPVNAIWTCKDTAAVATNTLTFNFANPTANKEIPVYSGNDGKTFRITWIYAGG